MGPLLFRHNRHGRVVTFAEYCQGGGFAALTKTLQELTPLQVQQMVIDSGLRGRVFWVVDQLDSLVGIFLVVAPVWQPSLTLVIASVVVMLVLHPLSAWVMVLAGLKDRVG